MRHQRLRARLGLKTEPRRALVASLACQLAKRGRIETTLDRAKAVQPFVDRMIMLARDHSLHARRQLVAHLHWPDIAESFISEISPSSAQRQGGFTRIIRHRRRTGDGAEMVLLEFTDPITRKEIPKEKKEKKKKPVSAKPPSAPEEMKKPKKPARPEGKAEKKEEKDQLKPEVDKEKAKKGGFLSALRRFIKGDSMNKPPA